MSKHVHTYSEFEFKELLTDENIVNIERLRESARYGVPQSVRGEVWKILLGVSNPDLSEEMSARNKMQKEFNKIQKLVNGDPHLSKLIQREIKKYCKQLREPNHWEFFNSRSTKARLEELIVLYLSNNPLEEFRSGMVSLMAPFVFCASDSVDGFHCFSQTMSSLGHNKLGLTLSRFLFLFRRLLPELYMHFEDEELNPNQWAVIWLKDMLACALTLECVMRLWDTYFASSSRWQLHIFVCLAILRHSSEDLMELECSDILYYLQNLPTFDMDQLIMHAYNTRDEVKEAELL